jgi:SprB repeat
MKIFKIFMLFLVATFAFKGAAAQDASINILAGGSGIVTVGGSIFLQVDVTNNDATGIIVANKVRPQISAPTGISSISLNAADHTLPAGWTITSNTGSVIRITNTTDPIPAGVTRTALIRINGGPSTGSGNILANLTFVGAAPVGDNPSNNSGTAGITVNPAAACTLGVTAAAGTIACNGGTYTLTATPSGATGAVEYSITGGAPFQPGNTFTVPAGTYTVTAREVATPTCTAASTSVTVTEPTAVVATGVVSTPIAVFGGTGAITVSAAGGTAGTTTYTIASGTTINTTGATTGVFTGLLAGTYTFVATKDGCASAPSAGVALNDPAPCIITGVTAAAGTILCNGGTTTLTATAAPAGPVYEYSLNGGAFQSGNTFTVAAGSYTVVAREAGNTVCTAVSSSVTVSQPTAVSATTAVTTPIAIPGGTGTITATGAGGTGAFAYVIATGTTINTTGATTGVFTGLLSGSYTFTVTDANGCAFTTAAIILADAGVATADPAVGQMFFTTTSGGVQSANSLLMAPASDLYDINVPFYNLNQVNGVPNGTIRFTVNLGRKLVLAPGFNLATAPLSTYFTWTQADVAGNIILTGTQKAAIPADLDSLATFRVKGDSACRSNVVANIVITNLLQTLVDDDLQNNAATLQYTLPITLTNSQVNVTCNTAGNGIINGIVSSGTTVVTTGPGGYTNTQNIGTGVNNFTLSGLLPGTYTITATAASDAPLASCSQVTTVIISEPTTLAIPAGSIVKTNISCFGTATGSIRVTAAGGTPAYVYTIAGPTVNTTGAITGIFTGLTAGSYTVTVTDNNGCTATTAAILITQPVGGIPDITLGSDFTGNFFAATGVSQTIVYNIAEIAGNASVGDTLRITKPAGFTITFNPTIFSTTVGATTYTLDNPRWKIDNSNPAFTSIILTDPSNATNPGTILCNQLVRVAVTLTRNTSNISTFTLSARLRRANGEVNLANNLNSIIMTAE